jgi:glycerophosphoryl diester phosphodiesterase
MKRWCAVVIMLTVCSWWNEACTSIASQPERARTLVTSDGTLVIAHRGNSSAAPENTLAAFQSAIEAGADLVELDYYHSADGVPIVFHDRTLDRTTDAEARFGKGELGPGAVPFEKLRQLDAGSWFDHRFAGARIPTLDESLDVIQPHSVTLIERKEGDAATCIQLLQEKDLIDQVVVQSFDWEYLQDCHRLAPELTMAALGSNTLTAERLEAVSRLPVQVVAWDHRDLRPDDVTAIQQRGKKVWVYTVNQPERAVELVGWGVDGVITDYPVEVRQRLEEELEEEDVSWNHDHIEF